jgi:hypothetical protein
MIKTFPVSTLFLVLLAIAAFGQTQPPTNTEIIWDYEQNCSARNDELVKAESPRCERIQTDQGTFFITSHKGVSVAVSYVTLRVLVRATTQITNRSGQQLKFDPVLSSIDVYNSQSAYQKGKKRKEVLPGLAADAAKQVYVKDEAKYVVIDPFIGRTAPNANSQIEGPKVMHIEANGSAAPTSSRQPVVPSRADQTRMIDEPRTPSQGYIPRIPISPNTPSVKALARFDYGVKAGPIADQQKAAGYLFFERTRKEIPFTVLRIKVGDFVFVFPEETLEDKKKLRKKN